MIVGLWHEVGFQGHAEDGGKQCWKPRVAYTPGEDHWGNARNLGILRFRLLGLVLVHGPAQFGHTQVGSVVGSLTQDRDNQVLLDPD